ncbi:hypothetical protein [Shinella sp.]|uniref:hypothetical protein n=1 Tax=Shinella sp. TaxID=1870904 RepID=UPI003F7113A3
MDHLFVKSSYQPEELAELKSIFDDVTGQSWFDPDAKVSFAKYLIETFPAEAFDAQRYRSVVAASARMFYCRESSAA